MGRAEGADELAAAPGEATYAYVASYANSSAEPSPDGIGLYVFQVDPDTGALTQVQAVTGSSPAWIEVDPSRRFLYACYSLRGGPTGRVGAIDAFAIDRRTGKLEPLNRVSLGDSGPSQLTIAPDGRHAVVANYYYGEYIVLPIGNDGRLGPVSGRFQNTGSGPHPRQDSAHPHAVAFDPRGRFLGTADLGIDKLQIFRLTGGGLDLVSEVSVPPGTGPRHIAFGRDSRSLYAIGELDGTVTAFAYDPTTGAIGQASQTLASEPPGYSGPPSGAEIAVHHPSGGFLYASNRGSQSVAGYRIDGSTGKLTVVGYATQGVSGPTNFVIDPSGRWLYVNSSTANSVVQFSIDHSTGELKPTGRTTAVPSPLVMTFRRPN
ncbi:lactonase family protein [Streptomyces sp. 35G-GA-8]|uniref:lactonase family protein n=1 Tax=Streptomyces sp. 35G-GA-8 TaxID=2939434 RepID=UPI00201F6976|nr:lactonase family protein [Streptomyces sp. 35G-GA-8]MCL7380563.1 lactonase family protein [Streptomyces sp. 35G-GA-8]